MALFDGNRLSASTLYDLTRCQHLPVASNRVKTQITLQAGRFFLTFHFILREKAMADAANKYAENAPGKFYVDDQCIDSNLCRETAAANFKLTATFGSCSTARHPSFSR